MKKDPLNFQILTKVAHILGKKSDLTVFEMGALDARGALAFNRVFPRSRIFTFECNPSTLPTCRAAVRDFPNITLTEKAVSDKNGTITFYPIDQEKTVTAHADGNPGASSTFKASGKYKTETYVQNEITVDAIRLDGFIDARKIEKIDLLWLDLQGGELKALQGLGTYISAVDCLHTEVEFIDIYTGQPLFADIKKYCDAHGLVFLCFSSLGKQFRDAIFVNKKLLKGSTGVRLRLFSLYYSCFWTLLPFKIKLNHFFRKR